LIRRKIIKIIATRCQILRLKCTKFDFVQTPLGELSPLPQTPQLDLRGPLRGRDGKREGMGKGERGGEAGEEERRRGEKGKGWRRKGGKVTEGIGGTGQDMG